MRYISGFSCEKGTVEDQAALKKLLARRAEQKKRAPGPSAAENAAAAQKRIKGKAAKSFGF